MFEFSEITLNQDKGYSVKKGEGINLLTEVKIPAEYDGLPVIDISSGAFHGCNNLIKIYIPDTILNIDYGSSGGKSKIGRASCRERV